MSIEGWEDGGDFRVANEELEDGTHALESDDPFGLTQFGWSSGEGEACPLSQNGVKCFSSYAHPAGIACRP